MTYKIRCYKCGKKEVITTADDSLLSYSPEDIKSMFQRLGWHFKNINAFSPWLCKDCEKKARKDKKAMVKLRKWIKKTIRRTSRGER